MGCICSKKPRKRQEIKLNSSSTPIKVENTGINLEELRINQNPKIEEKIIDEGKRNTFIDNFFAKNTGLNAIEKPNTIFITNLNKKMHISKDLITVEEDFILKVNLDSPNSYFNNYWMFLDAEINEIISKEIYIDDMKVDDSRFEVNNNSIKLEFGNTSNQETRKIRMIQKIRNQFEFYGSKPLLLNRQGVAARYLIYADNDLSLDEVSNNNYILNKDLNLAYFEGIITNQTENHHGFINYSKKINYKIYQYIPELTKDSVQNIIRKQEANREANLNLIANYKKIVITEYGQDIEEIYLKKVSNYDSGRYLSSFSLGLYKDIRSEIDLVEFNGKPFNYRKNGDSIEFNNIKCYNNQFIEIHLKYKYYFNENKDLYRQENVLLSNQTGAYCKSIVQIPDEYVVIAAKDIFQKSPDINNRYIYQGILNGENISECFKFCREKARWEIEQEYILEASRNIDSCEFTINKIFKGGNLKELRYDMTYNGAELTDTGENYVFKYDKFNSNKALINLKIKVENSTSNYYFNENKEYLTRIPPEEIQFFQSLVNQITSSDQSNLPDYKKIGKWVHNHIKYNLQLTGKKFTAMEIYNNKQGVCEHFTKLYNTLLTAYGIDAVKVCGYAKDITEYNTKVKKKEGDNNQNQNADPSGRHAWTLAKIDGEWVPLDATWDLFDKKVPITHIYENYGEGQQHILYNSDNVVKFKRTKENIKFVKN